MKIKELYNYAVENGVEDSEICFYAKINIHGDDIEIQGSSTGHIDSRSKILWNNADDIRPAIWLETECEYYD